MNVYTTDRIRNVVLLGHGGCGKTSIDGEMPLHLLLVIITDGISVLNLSHT